MKCGQLDDLITLGFKERNSGNDERVRVLFGQASQSRRQFRLSVLARTASTRQPSATAGILKGFQLVGAGDKTRVYQRSNSRRGEEEVRRNIPSRLASSAELKNRTPVALPAGRLKLATSPSFTGVSAKSRRQ